ncbi:MAG: hypothetical protein ACD_20C00147G0005 [uncultured bacterium]|nr:MAG: hypothetical protein ACD_20C00147G0005 [uncultured bacterium]HBH17823.1 hypothetical protein [Cyanobacteria bacterium UBA9579]
MVSGISDVSSLQILRATQAFKNAIKASLNSPGNQVIDDVEVKVSLSQESQNAINNARNNIQQAESEPTSKKAGYINEIKEYANKYGNIDINDEDINYAMRYGRSILVDQIG